MKITYDEAKRQANLVKHGLDLADAALVYDSPNKITLASTRKDEQRLVDIAMVEVMGVVLVLVYVVRGDAVRAISLRRASKSERRVYESAQQN
ncbi:BrnT family toxin [Thauera sp. Sel9]|uniref:BrnT family toxin n=1 Tax=Thauera sp. Sel9 TaxID=2974299 RepID=UPI0021E137D1|nr:BrnT family toxin [Thauera sp. Sel9]MCV2218887.1 BrnT family toxin [Thauera sp. Sel9]